MNINICKKCCNQDNLSLHIISDDEKIYEYNLCYRQSNDVMNCLCYFYLNNKCSFEEINPEMIQVGVDKQKCLQLTEQLLDFFNKN